MLIVLATGGKPQVDVDLILMHQWRKKAIPQLMLRLGITTVDKQEQQIQIPNYLILLDKEELLVYDKVSSLTIRQEELKLVEAVMRTVTALTSIE